MGFAITTAAMGVSFLLGIFIKWRYGDTGYQNIPNRRA